ncbi:MAG: hypothetical protein COX07_01195 [Bacteroidetes bacterium CG23_combo_of_CG06-09_8_20_14_all_32_9]|nr:MAG: hypothetical protein COX07_01195 [Bacteroidetes bacterium CG23_combo_of_CG06-09_8_20_14_all_32_9]
MKNANLRLIILLIVFVLAANTAIVAQKPVHLLNNSIENCRKCNKIFPEKIVENKIDSVSKQYIYCLRNKGFITASVDSVINKNDTFFVNVYQGSLYKWEDITFNDDKAGLMYGLGISTKKLSGKPIIYENIIRAKNKLLSNYENNGYPFVSIKTDSFEVSPGFISINYSVQSRELVSFDSLEITGNAKISNSYLEHYLGILSHKFYSEKKVMLINKRLKELTFLTTDKPSEVYFIDNKARVRLFLKEKKANQFNGILGIIPDAKTPGKLLLTGDISLNLINSFHRGEQINFSWKKLETASQNLFASVQLPYILNKPVGALASIKLFKKDSSFLNVTTHIEVPFYFTGANTIGIYYENFSSALLPASSLSQVNILPAISDFTSNIIGISIFYSSLDYKFNPRKGLIVKFQAGYGKKTIEKNPEINPSVYNGVEMNSFRNEFTADISQFTNITGKWVLKLRGQTGYINTKILLKNELYRIGGLSTLRGFDEESIYASVYGTATSEIRFLFEENSALFAFYDQGYYKNIDIKNDNPAGFGAGIEFQTKAGIFTLSYALGHQLGNSVQFRTARVHFGFVNRF